MHSAISLFTGAGGLDLGLHAAGFHLRVAIEADDQCVSTLRHPSNARWWRKTKIFHCALESLPVDQILQASDLAVGELGLLAGGPPCQPFSKSGYWYRGEARRMADARANTLGEYLRILAALQPQAFILENVPGISFSSKQEGLLFLESEIRKINKTFSLNYSFYAGQLNAADFGVPQMRKRVFIVGSRDGLPFTFPKPTHFPPPESSDRVSRAVQGFPVLSEESSSWMTSWDALHDLEIEDKHLLKVRGKWGDLLPSIPEGSNYSYHTDRGPGLRLFGWRTRYWSMLLKLAKSRPSWTLTAQPGPAIGPFHWENRRLAPVEMAALQTFPSGYVIEGSLADAQRQLGNAVPSLLAEVMGREIRRQFFSDGVSLEPSLKICRAPSTPLPALVRTVPEKYLDLVKDRPSHPGTGLGPGARKREAL